MSGPLDTDPMVAIITSVSASLAPVRVAGQRPVELADQLPVVVLSRTGGTEAESFQDVLRDRPIVTADCYADGVPEAFALAQDARRALRAAGVRRPITGPLQTPDDDESHGVARVTFSYQV